MAYLKQLGPCTPCKGARSTALQITRHHKQRGSVICASVGDNIRTSRRTLLGLVVGLGASAASQALADPLPSAGEPPPAVAFPVSTPAPTPQPNDPSIFKYDFVSDVPCNLRVKEYWAIINQARPRTWQQIAQQIQTGSYDILSIDLNLAPMADIRQAALYLPWALLQNYDYAAATDSMKAYKNLDEHVKDLQRAATVAAAVGSTDASAQQVQQAFILMSASLDGFLATVPTRYTATALSLFGKGNAANPPAPAQPPAPTPAVPPPVPASTPAPAAAPAATPSTEEP